VQDRPELSLNPHQILSHTSEDDSDEVRTEFSLDFQFLTVLAGVQPGYCSISKRTAELNAASINIETGRHAALVWTVV
jgi:hypothetical protein